MNRFAIGGAEAGGPALLVIAGPCVVEGAEMCLEVAVRLKTLCAERGLPYVFKAVSYTHLTLPTIYSV
jgi:3-deoxy-D-manno-octulosonic acid (KDO) 8-phosphate synthase